MRQPRRLTLTATGWSSESQLAPAGSIMSRRGTDPRWVEVFSGRSRSVFAIVDDRDAVAMG